MSGSTPRMFAPGTIINQYRIEREIGRGAMAVVYLAIQENLERPVALKILSDVLASNQDFVSRFMNEARAAASFSHPKIVQAFDAGFMPPDVYYFVMELIKGETLYDRILRDGPLKTPKALGIAVDIAEALNYGWTRQHLIHGDIKPENIMLSEAGETKLADFGLAKVAGHEFAGEGVMLTPLYAAPEVIQCRAAPNDCRSDIYSFGATLYHLLSGRPPFPGTDPQVVLRQHLEEKPPSLVDTVPRIAKEVSEFVTDRLLAKKPEERPQNWDEVLSSLEWFHSRRMRVSAPVAVGAGNLAEKPAAIPAVPVKAKTPAARPPGFTVVRLVRILAVLSLVYIVLAGMSYLQHREQVAEQVRFQAAATAWNTLKTRFDGEKDVFACLELIENYKKEYAAYAPKECREYVHKFSNLLRAGTPPPQGQPSAAALTGAQPALLPVETSPAGTDQILILDDDLAAVISGSEVIWTELRPAPVPELKILPPPTPLPVPPPVPAATGEDPLQRADAYTDFLSDTAQFLLRQPANFEPMMLEGKAWQKLYPGSSDENRQMTFLLETVVPAYEEFLPKLITRNEKVMGMQLAGRNFAGKPVKAVTLNEIILSGKTDYGAVDLRLPWSEVDRSAVLAQLGGKVFGIPGMALTERRPYWAFLLINRQLPILSEQLQAEAETPEKQLWLALQNDFSLAKLEGKALQLWREMQEAAVRKEYSAVYRLLLQLKAGQSAVFSRHEKECDILSLACLDRVPEAQAPQWVVKAQELLSTDPAASLALVNTALVRYGRLNFPEAAELPRLREQALQRLREEHAADLPRMVLGSLTPCLGAPPLPGYSALLLRELQQQKPPLQELNKTILPLLQGLTLLEMGDWAGARKPMTTKLAAATAAILPPHLQIAWWFGRALVADRFQDPDFSPATALMKLDEWRERARSDPKSARILGRILVDTASLTGQWAPEGGAWTDPAKLLQDPVLTADKSMVLMTASLMLEAGHGAELIKLLQDLGRRQNDSGDPAFINQLVTVLQSGEADELALPDVSDEWREPRHRFLVNVWLATRDEGAPPPKPKDRWLPLSRDLSDSGGWLATSIWFDVTMMRVLEALQTSGPEPARAIVQQALERQSPPAAACYPRLRFLLAGLEWLAGEPAAAKDTLATIDVCTVASPAETAVARAFSRAAKAEETAGSGDSGKAGSDAAMLFWKPWLEWSRSLAAGEAGRAKAARERMSTGARSLATRAFAEGLATVSRPEPPRSAAPKP